MSEITSLAQIVRVHRRDRGQHTAIIQGERRLTWAELYERSCRAAQALADAGVGLQDRVAFLDKNGVEHFEVFFGAALLNAVCVDVNWRLAAPEVEYVVNDAEAKVLVVGPDFVPVLDAIAAHLSGVDKIVVIGGHERYESYTDWVGRYPSVDPGAISALDDVAFQLYSSGTTGRPKGVMLSNNNFFGLLPAAKEIWELSADVVNLVAMPLFHIGGGGWATAGMYEGCTSVIVRELDPAALVAMFGELRITHAFLVPVALQFMLMVPGVEHADFSSLRVMVYGASPISDEVLAKSIDVFRCKFWLAYGLTESTGTVVNLPPEDQDLNGPNRHRLRSCGVAGPGVELRIVDADAAVDNPSDNPSDNPTDLPTGEVGEIWVRSRQVMKGYWHLPEETARAITPETWGETGKAIVVRAADVTEQELIEYCRQRLARFKCPTSVDWTDALPRNPSGKILKKDLRAPYWEGRTRFVS